LEGVKFHRRILRFIKVSVFMVITEAVRLFVPRGRNGGSLVLKIDALGDLFIWMSSGMADVSRFSHTGGPTTLVARGELADFINSFGLFDEVLPLDIKRFDKDLGYRWKLLADIRRRGYDQVLQMRIARQFTLEDSIVRAAGTSAIGPLGDRSNLFDWEAAIGDRYYKPLITFTTQEHEMLRNRKVTKALTGRTPSRFEIDLSNAKRSEVVAGDYFILAPGAGWPGRKWPVDNFIAVAKSISGLQCVVTGTASEEVEGNAISSAVGGLNLCGKIELIDLIALVKGAKFILANESGISHVAGYCNTPSMSILGGGHYGWFMPYPEECGLRFPPQSASYAMPCYNCNWRCHLPHRVGGPVPCIEAVSVQSVRAAIAAILRDAPAREYPGGSPKR
jgi:ADP-heptose:LPS heptosyltransferase